MVLQATWEEGAVPYSSAVFHADFFRDLYNWNLPLSQQVKSPQVRCLEPAWTVKEFVLGH